MATSKRDEVLKSAWRLFESQGYHATGINQIITESGVPKGSFYHYFPEGKEGLACEAVSAISDGMHATLLKVFAATDGPVEAIEALFSEIGRRLSESGYREGGPLTTLALETATTNERINTKCRSAYATLQREFTEWFTAEGIDDSEALALSSLIIAGLEGGILLSRTHHSTEPMEQIARQLTEQIETRLNQATISRQCIQKQEST